MTRPGPCVPCPAGECFESGDAIGSQLLVPIEGPLIAHPMAQPVVVLKVTSGYLGMTLALDGPLAQVSPSVRPGWIERPGGRGSVFGGGRLFGRTAQQVRAVVLHSYSAAVRDQPPPPFRSLPAGPRPRSS